MGRYYSILVVARPKVVQPQLLVPLLAVEQVVVAERIAVLGSPVVESIHVDLGLSCYIEPSLSELEIDDPVP
jgi:hypothetical protein